jgi:hypothetical protein
MRRYITISRILYPITYILLPISRISYPVTIYITPKEIAILIISFNYSIINNIFYISNKSIFRIINKGI